MPTNIILLLPLQDILLIEAIFLFQDRFLSYYDYKVWVDCSFEKYLERAIKRNAEKLDVKKLIEDYHIFYYAAQRYHMQKDDPLKHADIIFANNHQ